jgi:hypothetical protein
MSFHITISEIAEKQTLSAREQSILKSAIASRLTDHPTQVSRAIKKLRANPFAEYELRVGETAGTV